MILLSVLLGAVGQILMKLGTTKIQLSMVNVATNIHILSGLALYGLSAVFWIVAISKLDLSYAYPMVALGYVVAFILSYFILGESIPPLRIFGLCTIVLGVLIIAKS